MYGLNRARERGTLKRRLFPFCPRWEALSLPPPPSSLFLSLPSCRFLFGGRVLDIACPASIVTGTDTVQLAQIPLLTTIQWRTTRPCSVSLYKCLVQESNSLLEVKGPRATWGIKSFSLEMSGNLVRFRSIPKKTKTRPRACWEIKLKPMPFSSHTDGSSDAL